MSPSVLDPWHVFSASFGTMPKPFTAFATLLDMVLYVLLATNVTRARFKYKVPSPSTDGPENFMKILRVQVNTTEQLVLHLPLLWIAAFAMDDMFAAAFGAVWLAGRVLYARGYYQKPKRRIKGFFISMAVNVILFAGALMGTMASF